MDDDVLECQECGDVVRRLSVEEAHQVALNPERFIVTCRQCAKELSW